MVSQPIPILTPDEYLAWEHEQEFKHEYFDGEIVATAGAKFAHNLIVRNLHRSFAKSLEGTDCSEFGSDFRVAINTRSFCYPDLLVACEPFQFLPGTLDTLINPSMLIEVLSPSTRGTDHKLKLPRYRNIPSLIGYLFIEQDRTSVEYGRRVSSQDWQVETFTSPADRLELAPLPVVLGVSQIYTGVQFTA